MGTYLRNAYDNSGIKFSVIIPVYNVDKFLRECLDSISSQTLKEFEVICVNDGSTDNSLDILEEYAKNDSRFKIISQENQGQGIARNVALEKVKGKYIVFVDPDDFINIDMLETLYNKFQLTDVDIIQFDFATCKENGKYSGTKEFKKRMKKYFHYSIKNNEIYNWHDICKNLKSMSLCIWDKAYKTDLIRKNNIKLAPNKHGEDHIFSISADLLANKILYLNKAFYHYRTRIGSAVNKASNDNFCIFENIKLLKSFLEINNFYKEFENSYNDYVVEVLSWHYSNIPIRNIERYCKQCADILSAENYKDFLNRTKGKFSNWEEIFSIKNKKINGIKTKYITLLGLHFEISKAMKGDE